MTKNMDSKIAGTMNDNIIMDSTTAGSKNDSKNMNSTITESINDKINIDRTTAGSMDDNKT